jgi:hypothetical protein
MRSQARALAFGVFGSLVLLGCSSAEPTLLPPGSVQPGIPAEFRIQTAEILQAESWPVQVRLEISGMLTSACHEIETQVSGPDESGQITVEAVEELVEEAACAGGGETFREAIPIGDFTEGQYVILLNGDKVGEFDVGGGAPAAPPQSGDDGRDRGPVYIDEAELTIKESFPVQVDLVVRGSLPTPCATLAWTADPPDEQGRIFVIAYSLQDPAVDCIQVLEAMEAELPIGSYSEGSYTVWLNGEQVGEFTP